MVVGWTEIMLKMPLVQHLEYNIILWWWVPPVGTQGNAMNLPVRAQYKKFSSSLDEVSSLWTRQVLDRPLQECAGLNVWVRLGSSKGSQLCLSPFRREKNRGNDSLSSPFYSSQTVINIVGLFKTSVKASVNKLPLVTPASPDLSKCGISNIFLGKSEFL